MERLDLTAVRALRGALDQQPLTDAKVRFAWTLAAGPALARAASVQFADGVLHVRPKSDAWRPELVRSRPLILERIGQMIGPDAVRSIAIVDVDTRR
jgi:hypothetical protein